jgi:serine/threonine protein kinase
MQHLVSTTHACLAHRYRDVKPSNVMWNETTRRATLIDFDVATFFDPEHLHRRAVGTDGYRDLPHSTTERDNSIT